MVLFYHRMKIMSDETGKSSVIHRVLAILLLFQDRQERYSVEEISQVLDMPKSTVYRYVRILHETELLEKIRPGGIWPRAGSDRAGA